MKPIRFLPAIVVAAISIGGCRGAGPGDVALPAECAACSISVRTVWESSPGNSEVMDPMRAFRLGTGDVVITDHRSMRLVRFDPEGATVGTIGGPGEGPGEFRTIVGAARLPDGRFLISSVDRVSILSEALEPLGSFRPDVAINGRGIVPLTDSTILLAETSRTRGGTSMQVYDLSGGLVASFDTISASRGGASASLAPDGTVWMVPTPDFSAPAEYHLMRWNPGTGDLLGEVRRRPPWFAEWSPPDGERAHEQGAQGHPMRPVVYDIFVDEDGIVWTLTMVQDPSYTPGADPAPQRRTDSVLEALDPEGGSVLAARSFDAVITGFSLEGELVSYTEDAAGRPALALLSVTLERQRPRSPVGSGRRSDDRYPP